MSYLFILSHIYYIISIIIIYIYLFFSISRQRECDRFMFTMLLPIIHTVL